MLVFSSLCQNVLLLRPFNTKKEMKTTRRQVWADDGVDQILPIKNASGACLLQLHCVAEHCHEGRPIPEDKIPRRFFWIKEPNYSFRPTLGGRLYFLGMFTGSLRAQNWQVRCVAIEGIPEKLRNTLPKASSDYHCGSNFATNRILKKK